MRITKAQLIQLAYGLGGVVVVLLIILVLSAREHQQEIALRDELLATERRASEEKLLRVFETVQATERYKKYCTPVIQRVDKGNDWLKLVYRTPQRYDLYIRDEKKVWCVPDATASSSECEAASAVSYETALICPEREVSSMIIGKNALQISSQPAGAAVVVDHAVLDQNGFIVVRASDNRGRPSDVLATSSFLKAGGYDLVSIPIPKSLLVGLRYFISLSIDADDNGIYDPGSDKDLMTDTDQLATATFRAIKE